MPTKAIKPPQKEYERMVSFGKRFAKKKGIRESEVLEED